MSAETATVPAETANGPSLYEMAESNLLSQVYAPVFFDKLASYGVLPANDAEAYDLLNLDAKLRYLEEQDMAKTASERTSWISRANQGLDALLGQQPHTAAQALDENMVQKAAADMCRNEQIRDSALLYQDALQQLLGAPQG